MKTETHQTHPATATLDAWRAGLLATADADTLTAHVATCGACAQAAQATDAIHRLAKNPSSELERQLRVRRRAALTAAPRRLSMLAPKWALAASVSAMALGLALYFGAGDRHTGPGIEGDVYADVDFYLWLAERDERTNHAHNPS